MVIADADIEEYIKLDLSEEHKAEETDPKATEHLKLVQDQKKMFKANLCQKVSIIRLGYMLKVLYAVHPGKASMLGADAYIAKVKKEEKAARIQQRKEQGIANGVSMYGGSGSIGSSLDNFAQGNEGVDVIDPVLKNIDSFVKNLKQQIVDASQQHLKTINTIIGMSNNFGMMPQRVDDTIEENLKQLEVKKGVKSVK